MDASRKAPYGVLFLVVLCLALILLSYPAIADPNPSLPDPLDAAWPRAREAGAYRFTADVEQVLIPRLLPPTIGRADERVDMRLEGEVALPDQARIELRLEGEGANELPLTLVRDGTQTYLLKDGERVALDVLASAGLGVSAVSGAGCVDCPPGGEWWSLELPPIEPGASHTVTLTGVLAADLTGILQVDVSVKARDLDDPLPDPEPGPCEAQAHASHRVDGQPPSIRIDTSGGGEIGTGPQTVTGMASDWTGSGVASVEYSVEGGAWAPALGTLNWSAGVDVPSDATTLEFRARTADACGHTAEDVAVFDVVPTAVNLVAFGARVMDGAIILEWETANEVSLSGFHIYRQVAGGELTRLNPALIPGQVPGSPQGASYQFFDEGVEPGVTYRYWLEMVTLEGRGTRYGPASAQVPPARLPSIYLPLVLR